MTRKSKIYTAMAGLTLTAGMAAPAFAQGEPAPMPAPATVPGPGPVTTMSAPAPVYAPVAPAPLAGALPGTTAADLSGDGIADGYHTSDGDYHAFTPPAPPLAVHYVSRRGERG